MIKTLERVSGKAAMIDWQPVQQGDVTYTCADISKSRNTLGYNPVFSFEAGIKNFIKWFEQSDD
jgi:UDP-glucuronate 4-epimerase